MQNFKFRDENALFTIELSDEHPTSDVTNKQNLKCKQISEFRLNIQPISPLTLILMHFTTFISYFSFTKVKLRSQDLNKCNGRETSVVEDSVQH